MIRTTPISGLLALATLSAIGVFANPAQASNCSATVEANDAMQFNTKALTVPKGCKSFAVTLKHTGKLPVTAMGHNLVVTRTADLGAVASDGMKAGAAASYLKTGDKRVIAGSKLVGGGQSTTFNIPVSKLKAGESYSYVCTFPGHSSIMRGTLALK